MLMSGGDGHQRCISVTRKKKKKKSLRKHSTQNKNILLQLHTLFSSGQPALPSLSILNPELQIMHQNAPGFSHVFFFSLSLFSK